MSDSFDNVRRTFEEVRLTIENVRHTFARSLLADACRPDGVLRFHTPGCNGKAGCECKEFYESVKKGHPLKQANLELILIQFNVQFFPKQCLQLLMHCQLLGDLEKPEVMAYLLQYYQKMRVFAMENLNTGILPSVFEEDVRTLVKAAREHFNHLRKPKQMWGLVKGEWCLVPNSK